ncbi:MAG: TIR domain-containing protein [Heteroscytonema crispum UTEX LB 1556]
MNSDTVIKKILVLAANPRNTCLLRLDEEVREIDEGLRRANKREQFKLEQKWALRSRDFYRAILDYQPDIVHFCGHGAGEDGIILENETKQPAYIQADTLASMFKLFARNGVKCVVLNACYSEVQAEAISQHINYVIGMNWAIGDRAAINFAVAFYDALGAGQDIEFAFELGCSQINTNEQQTPILKKKPNFSNTVVESSFPKDIQHPVENKKFMSMTSTKAIEVFFSYAPEDEKMRGQLEKHLSLLKRQEVITGWHDRKIGAGKEWKNEIDRHLNTARIILLLVSADFIALDYCWDVEVTRAMERHEANEARVIPIIINSVDWKSAPFGRLQPLPKGGKPVKKWGNHSDAFENIAQGIRTVAAELASNP